MNVNTKGVVIKLAEPNLKPTTENPDAPFSEIQKPPQFPFLFRRFIEIFITSVICSVPIALLYGVGILSKSDYWAIRIMSISLFAFVALNIYLLRAFYYSMGNRRIYFNVNLVAYAIFSIINLGTLIIFKDNSLPSLYSYLFMPMKYLNVVMNMLGSTASLKIQILAPIVTHIIMYAIIFIAPLEMYTFDRKKK